MRCRDHAFLNDVCDVRRNGAHEHGRGGKGRVANKDTHEGSARVALRSFIASRSSTISGGTKARGCGAAKLSTGSRYNSVVPDDEACASRDVSTSAVSTFGLPWRSSEPDIPGSSGSNRAPVASTTTPGRTSSVITAPVRHAPRNPQSYHRAGADASALRFKRIDMHWLSFSDLARAAIGAVVVLTVQATTRLIRHEMKSRPVPRGCGEPFARLYPRRMGRAVAVAEFRYGRGGNFDLAGRRAQRPARTRR